MPLSNTTILLLHTDTDWLTKVSALLQQNNANVITATSLGDALELASKYKPHLILTSLKLESTEPQEILDALRHQHSKAAIDVLINENEDGITNHLAPGTFFDSIIMHCNDALLIAHVREALDFFREKNSLLQYMQEYKDRIEDQIEWLIWKEQKKHAYKVSYSQALISNIRNTILQGMGLGSLVTRMGLLEMKMKEDNGNYILPGKDMDAVFASVNNIHRWLESLENINRAFNRSYAVETVDSEQFSAAITKAVASVENFRKIKNHQIEIADLTIQAPVKGNIEGIELCIRELLMNAFKFSAENSMIQILLFESPKIVLVGILNDVLPMTGGVTGIPQGYENQVYEPFYKLNNIYDERFFGEDFSMGTGLTIVQGTMQQMGGRIFHHEIVDHSSPNTNIKRIMADLVFNRPGSHTDAD